MNRILTVIALLLAPLAALHAADRTGTVLTDKLPPSKVLAKYKKVLEAARPSNNTHPPS